MAYYIKVAQVVAEKIGAPIKNRNNTADGNILLWQADLNLIPGETILDRAAYVGGIALEARRAKEEIDGTAVPPAEVTIPDYYQDKVDEKPVDDTNTDDSSQSDKPVTLPAGEKNGEIINESETSNSENV